jgi:hypothetical protein
MTREDFNVRLAVMPPDDRALLLAALSAAAVQGGRTNFFRELLGEVAAAELSIQGIDIAHDRAWPPFIPLEELHITLELLAQVHRHLSQVEGDMVGLVEGVADQSMKDTCVSGDVHQYRALGRLH